MSVVDAPEMQMQTSKRFTDPRFFAKNPKMEYAFIMSTLLSQVFTQAAATASLPLLQVLGNYYHSNASDSVWYMSSFSLAQGTLILISGRVGDIYGLRNAILGGYLWTTVWAILTGIASYLDTAVFFIVARAMCGAGLAFVLPNAMGVAGRIYRPGTRRKHMIFSLIGLSAPVGGGLEPVFTGLIATETPHWEWAFYHYAIGLFAAMILAYISVPYITPHRREEPDVEVDWIGCFIGICGMVLFNFVWNQAPAVGWGTDYIIALLVVSVFLLVLFVWYEVKIPKNPLIPRQVMKDSRMMLTILVLLLSWGSFGIFFYRFFVFVEELRHYSPLAAGASITPAVISGSVAAVVCGILISRIHAQYLLVMSMIVFLCSDVVLLTMPVHQTYFRQSMGLWILCVWGMDWSFPAGSIILSDELPPKFQGMAGSLLTTATMYGQSLFLGISSTIEDQILKKNNHDLLKAHKACMYFAIGLSGSAVIFSGVVMVMTLWPSKQKNVEKELEDGCDVKADECEKHLSYDAASKENSIFNDDGHVDAAVISSSEKTETKETTTPITPVEVV